MWTYGSGNSQEKQCFFNDIPELQKWGYQYKTDELIAESVEMYEPVSDPSDFEDQQYF